MFWGQVQFFLTFFQHLVSICGILVILTGVLVALVRYFNYALHGDLGKENAPINGIRLHLGRSLILGLEFIVAADLIGTTTTPDYYSLGMLAIIVAIRTLLTFSINRELMLLNKKG